MSYIRKIIEVSATLPLVNTVLPFVKRSLGPEMQVRLDLVRFGGILHQQGFVAATDGNLSVRLDSERVMTTPTGFSKGMLQPEDMVIVDLQGEKLSGANKPTSEIDMHLTIYRMRPDVGAGVHAHPCTATGFASAGIALDKPLCSESVVTYGADLAQAYMRMEAVEHYAKVVLAVRQLGSAQALDPGELEKLAAIRARYGANAR